MNEVARPGSSPGRATQRGPDLLQPNARRVITTGGWLFTAVFVLGFSLLVVPSFLAPLLTGLPQGSAELISYYAAWWLVNVVGLATLARRRGLANPEWRAFTITSIVMLFSLVIAATLLRPLLYPYGEYVNLGLQSVYLVVGALIVPNVALGTVLTWRGIKLSLGLSLLLSIGWAAAFLSGLVIAALLVEMLLVGARRG